MSGKWALTTDLKPGDTWHYADMTETFVSADDMGGDLLKVYVDRVFHDGRPNGHVPVRSWFFSGKNARHEGIYRNEDENA